MKNQTEPQAIVVEVTEEEFRSDLESGLTEDEVLRPGRHIFRRGGFLARHRATPEDIAASEKVNVALILDKDVLAFFTERAERTNTASYQSEINAALREVMIREKA